MIPIDESIAIDEDELRFSFVRAGGPGGQHVNKVATAVQLRFDVAASPSLPEAVRQRLTTLGGRRVNSEGVLIIEARRFRSQDRNRQDAVERLVALIRKATEEPKVRRKTRPSAGAKRRRLEDKTQRAQTKLRRSKVSRDEE